MTYRATMIHGAYKFKATVMTLVESGIGVSLITQLSANFEPAPSAQNPAIGSLSGHIKSITEPQFERKWKQPQNGNPIGPAFIGRESKRE